MNLWHLNTLWNEISSRQQLIMLIIIYLWNKCAVYDYIYMTTLIVLTLVYNLRWASPETNCMLIMPFIFYNKEQNQFMKRFCGIMLKCYQTKLYKIFHGMLRKFVYDVLLNAVFVYSMPRTRYFLIRWWPCLLYIRQTCWV